MLTRSQSPAGTAHAQAHGYNTLSRCLFVMLVMPPACFLSACSKDKKFGFGLGDQIAIVGNLLAERMQHDGWLEACIQAVHPDHRLVFRNLHYSRDLVYYRPRAQDGFGDSDSHLADMEANVIFGFSVIVNPFKTIRTLSGNSSRDGNKETLQREQERLLLCVLFPGMRS